MEKSKWLVEVWLGTKLHSIWRDVPGADSKTRFAFVRAVSPNGANLSELDQTSYPDECWLPEEPTNSLENTSNEGVFPDSAQNNGIIE